MPDTAGGTSPSEAPRPRNAGALLVTRNLPPLLGGMERLNLHLARELSVAGPLTVVGPRGSRATLPGGIRVVEVPDRPLARFLAGAARAAWAESKCRPAVVIAGSGVTAPIAVLAACRAAAKSAAYVHGLDVVATHPIYRLVWMPFLRRLDVAWANSASTADLAARAGVANRRISILHPGVAIPAPADGSGPDFRRAHGLGTAPVLLSVGRLTARKGLPGFIRQAFPEVLRRHPDTTLVVIGGDATDAIDTRGRGMAAAILDAASSAGALGAVRLLPHCDDSELAAAYRAADLHVFPVVQARGDIEGFGMVAVEAAAHGLPTVAFAAGGVPDAVSHGASGWLVRPGDYPAFAEAVCRGLEGAARERMRDTAREFAEGFRWERFGDRLRGLLADLLAAEPPDDRRAAGHAVLDLESRSRKAMKIEAVLGLEAPHRSLRMLEVGTGSGGIAHYFGTHRSRAFAVDSVDVRDSRQLSDGYRFRLVNGVALPFADGSFDVVISNHVIEHVGDEEAQFAHLSEIRRVLAPGGRCYLAVPNRWMLVEPHYRLAFLSWLPRDLRSTYLRWRRGVPRYDCEPLTTSAAERLFARAGLEFERAVGRATKLTLALEGSGRPLLRAVAERLSDDSIDAMAAAVPTLVYRLRARSQAGEAEVHT